MAVGGGGLASGVAGIIKAVSLHDARHRLLAGGLGGDVPLACRRDGSSTCRRVRHSATAPPAAWSPDAITFDLLAELLDDFVTVDEADIRRAFLDLIEIEHLLVEGSAAMAYAAARDHARPGEGTIAVILCGGNVGVEKLTDILT